MQCNLHCDWNQTWFYLVPQYLRLLPVRLGFHTTAERSSITGKPHLEWIMFIITDLPRQSSSNLIQNCLLSALIVRLPNSSNAQRPTSFKWGHRSVEAGPHSWHFFFEFTWARSPIISINQISLEPTSHFLTLTLSKIHYLFYYIHLHTWKYTAIQFLHYYPTVKPRNRFKNLSIGIKSNYNHILRDICDWKHL